ncbi:Na(+)/H(+) antiporter subunit B [bacterium]|nr:Na(+)/H(+) antiporter subunit B [bacterium]
MINKLLIIIGIIGMLLILLPILVNFQSPTNLSALAEEYVRGSVNDLKSPNVVTSVVVTYRGLDTLGEVTVLFLATLGVGFLLENKKNKSTQRTVSENIRTTSSFLVSLIMVLGIYIFTHGHLSPGGGFQGGVVIASGFLLLILSDLDFKISHAILRFVESISGLVYVLIGLIGLVLTIGFLNPAILPLGKYGDLFSAGAIPLIYSLIGLKVGSELTNIIATMGSDRSSESVVKEER